MSLEVTDSPNPADEAFVIGHVHAYNAQFTEKDVRRLCVFTRLPDGTIIGGLTGKTYWGYLEVAFLWVAESQRKAGHGTGLLQAAETEARRRGCQHAILDTYSYQALGFYQKNGYKEFGRLTGFSGRHERYYLRKEISVC
jgi:GNAT superfamily N-acetyltransferase